MLELHYEFTGETKDYRDSLLDVLGHKHVTLRRIKATRDLPHHGVKKGDLGGWIESTRNLVGEAWVADEAKIFGKAGAMDKALVADEAVICSKAIVGYQAKVYGNAILYGKALVIDNAEVFGNTQVCGKAFVGDCAKVYGNAKIYGTAAVYDSASVSGNAEVFGNAKVSSMARMTDNTKAFGNAQIHGKAEVSGNAKVSGEARVKDNAKVFGDAYIFGDATISLNSRISKTSDYLCFITGTSDLARIYLTRQENGEHHIIMGRWEGTIDKLEELIQQDKWADITGDEVERLRPETLAVCTVLRARIESWQKEGKA